MGTLISTSFVTTPGILSSPVALATFICNRASPTETSLIAALSQAMGIPEVGYAIDAAESGRIEDGPGVVASAIQRNFRPLSGVLGLQALGSRLTIHIPPEDLSATVLSRLAGARGTGGAPHLHDGFALHEQGCFAPPPAPPPIFSCSGSGGLKPPRQTYEGTTPHRVIYRPSTEIEKIGDHWTAWQGLPQRVYELTTARGGGRSLRFEDEREYIWVGPDALKAYEETGGDVLFSVLTNTRGKRKAISLSPEFGRDETELTRHLTTLNNLLLQGYIEEQAKKAKKGGKRGEIKK